MSKKYNKKNNSKKQNGVKLDPDVHKILKMIKADHSLRSISNAVSYLFKKGLNKAEKKRYGILK